VDGFLIYCSRGKEVVKEAVKIKVVIRAVGG
jgi:hypothetical protein